MDIEQMSEEDIEKTAKAQGWNENFEGEGKKSAKEFLEFGLEHNTVLKERLEKLTKASDEARSENKQTKAELKKARETMEKLVKFQDEQKKRAVDKAIKALKEQRREAVKDGDADRVDALDSEIEAERDTLKGEPPKAETPEVEVDPAFETWKGSNSWYDKDPKMRTYADSVARFVAAEHQDLVGTPMFYDAVLEEVKLRYPDKFSNPARNEPGAVEGGRGNSKGKKGKTFEDLPPEAKAAYAEFAEQMPNFTKEDYLATYEWE